MVRMGLPRLVFDPSSLSRSAMGTRTGVIYFDSDGDYFPSRNWSDLAPDVAYAWLHALITLSAGQSTTEIVFFMDGPYSVELTQLSSEETEVCFWENRPKARTPHGCITSFSKALLQDAISVAEIVHERCCAEGWEQFSDQVKAMLTEARKLLWKLKGKPGPTE
jgi:hypothetical protein